MFDCLESSEIFVKFQSLDHRPFRVVHPTDYGMININIKVSDALSMISSDPQFHISSLVSSFAVARPKASPKALHRRAVRLLRSRNCQGSGVSSMTSA